LEHFYGEDVECLHDRIYDFDEIQGSLNGLDTIQILRLGGSGEAAPVECVGPGGR
jgi:hypothetical protein